MRNPCVDAAIAELEAAGVHNFQLAHGGKHLQVRWRVSDHHPLRVAVIPATPSDHRSPQNTRRDVRRLLRLDDMVAVARPTP
jgi:hypothetical protein